MLLWQGSCLVHDEFKGIELDLLKAEYPQAKVLVHPESPANVVALADVVGSTTQMINAAQTHGRRHLHRRHRQRHPAQDARGRAGQALHRSADRRQQRHLQELRALPVDGDERPAESGRRAGKRATTKSTSIPPSASRPCARSTACSTSPPPRRPRRCQPARTWRKKPPLFSGIGPA